MGLTQQERDRYSAVWGDVEEYGSYSPGEKYAPVFAQVVAELKGRTVLDAGAGSGKGALALRELGFDVTLCDITRDGLDEEARALPFLSGCLWHPQGARYDFVYCCDVLEHVPTQFTMLVVRELLAAARQRLFLSVSLMPDHFGNWIGEPLHLTVQPFVWWRDSLREIGHVRDARDLGSDALFVMEPF